MRTCKWLITGLLIGALACPSPVCAQKITEDPNAPGTHVGSSESQFDDSEDRLAHRVTLSVRRTSEAKILSVLSEQTGVDLRAGVNSSDWQVRDRRMNIFCKDLPLSNLMNSIARVMKFKWSKEKLKDGTWAYRLYMDRKTLLDQEAQVSREEERRAKLEAERRQKALETYAGLANLSDADLAKLRSENPFKYLIATSGVAKPMSGLFAESPSLFQALASGQAANLQASSLSPRGQSYLADTWKGLHKIMSTAGALGGRTPEEMSSDMDQVTIKINPHREMMSNAPPSFLGMVQIQQTDGARMDLPLLDPDSSLGKIFGEMVLESMETGRNLSDMEREEGRETRSRISSAFAADMKSASPAETKKERPDDPALRVKVKISSDSGKLADIQMALADAAGIAVVSDSFRQRIPGTFPNNKEMELGELLDKIGDGFRYDWDKPGSAVEFRDKKWFAKRAAQIPDAWIEAWRAKLEKMGTLELEDIAQICSLTPEQFDESISEDRMLTESGLTANFYGDRDVLRLYNSLSESQRVAAFAKPGLDLSLLSAEQWEKASKAITGRNPSVLNESEGPLSLFIERIDYARTDPQHSGWGLSSIPSPIRPTPALSWDFKLSVGDQRDKVRWTVRAPMHTPKKSEEKPTEQKQGDGQSDQTK